VHRIRFIGSTHGRAGSAFPWHCLQAGKSRYRDVPYVESLRVSRAAPFTLLSPVLASVQDQGYSSAGQSGHGGDDRDDTDVLQKLSDATACWEDELEPSCFTGQTLADVAPRTPRDRAAPR
jgi:hypothetical protein